MLRLADALRWANAALQEYAPDAKPGDVRLVDLAGPDGCIHASRGVTAEKACGVVQERGEAKNKQELGGK